MPQTDTRFGNRIVILFLSLIVNEIITPQLASTIHALLYFYLIWRYIVVLLMIGLTIQYVRQKMKEFDNIYAI